MMRRKLFSLGGTAVYLHLATLLFAAYMVLLGHGGVLGISMLSILLHETAHAAVAAAFGKPPEEIEITPLGAVMRLEHEAELPLCRRFLMLAAGPVMSFLLCWAAILLTSWNRISVHTGRLMFCCNVMLLLLNLLPALPLDGGRMLALLLGIWLRQETVCRVMRVTGTLVGMSCIGLNLILSLRWGGWNLSLSMAGCFIMYAAAVGTTTQAMAELKMLMERKIRLERKGALACCWLTVVDTLPLRQAIKRLHASRYTMLNIVELGSMKRLDTCGEDALIATYLNESCGSCRLLLREEVCEKH